jgi:hypothetical protein
MHGSMFDGLVGGLITLGIIVGLGIAGLIWFLVWLFSQC